MKGILVFKLPEEQDAFDDAQKGTSYLCALEDMDNWLRQLSKYTDQETVTIDEARQKLREFRRDVE